LEERQASRWPNGETICDKGRRTRTTLRYERYEGSCKFVSCYIRKKIECLASNQGVPRTKEENDLLKDHYFEFHIKCIPKKTKNQGDSVDDVIDVPKLKELSESLGKKLGIRIPLSYNGLRPSQRFLNTRTYGIGRDASLKKIDEIKNTINQLENVKVEKSN